MRMVDHKTRKHPQCIAALIGSFFILSLCIITLQSSNSTAQSIQPETVIDLHQAEQTAQVAPGEKGVVTFTGTVYCDVGPVKGSVQSVMVSLEANAGGWPWSLSPSTMEFTAEHTEEDFSVSVRVPPRTSHVITQQLTISGRATMSPGATQYQLDPATAMINVAQFYILDASCEETTKDLGPGYQTAFSFDVVNEGNDQDHVRLDIERESEEDLTENGVMAEFEKSDFIIDEGSKEECKLTVTAPRDLNGNDLVLIKLRIYSIQSEQTGNGTVEVFLSLYLRLEENFDPEEYADPEDDGNNSGYVVVYPQSPTEDEESASGFLVVQLIGLFFVIFIIFSPTLRYRARCAQS